MTHASAFTDALCDVLTRPDVLDGIDELASLLAASKLRGGRLFVLGVGGGAANAAHAASDFRKLCGIEAYAPTDGIAEITARTNDDGWETVFREWLVVSRLGGRDALLVFSVGGGTPTVSPCIWRAVQYASECRALVLGVVGRSSGAARRLGVSVIVAEGDAPGSLGQMLTPVTESLQVAVIHALVTDPRLMVGEMKW